MCLIHQAPRAASRKSVLYVRNAACAVEILVFFSPNLGIWQARGNTAKAGVVRARRLRTAQ